MISYIKLKTKETMSETIKKPRTLDEMPEIMNSYDLVELGLYPSVAAVYLARHRSEGPSYIKLKRTVLYHKEGIRDFIKNHLKTGTREGK